jgi:hypothetical protein
MVTEYCTCGAKVPEDARFCHKCGRPLVDVTVAEPEPESVLQGPVTPPLAAAEPRHIGFRNAGAVRIGMFVAAAISLLQSIPLPGFVQPLWLIVLLLGGGFGSVYLYHRRTGDYLSVISGARLGWMTGMFAFLITMVLFTISIIAIATGDGLQRFFRELVTARGTPELAEQFDTILQSPGATAALLLLVLVLMFFMLTIVASIGGALAAKVLEKE